MCVRKRQPELSQRAQSLRDGLPSVALYLATPTLGKGFRSRSMDGVTLRNDPRFVKGGGLRQRASKRKGFKVQENLMGVKDLIDKKGLERTQQRKKSFGTTRKLHSLFSTNMTLNAHVKKQTPSLRDQTLSSPQGFYYLQHAVQ